MMIDTTVIPHKPMLEAVARNYQGPLELEFVAQDHPRGLGDALLRARDNLAGSPFMAVLPDNLFHGSNPSVAVLSTFRATGLATVLLAEIERKDAASKGAAGRAAVRKAPDGTLRVIGVADKGAGLFDTAGDEVAVAEALAGVISPARFFDVGVPEGYRDPARA